MRVAVAATTIAACANPNMKHTARNPDGPAGAGASWTKKHSARDPLRPEWVFGYKAYVVRRRQSRHTAGHGRHYGQSERFAVFAVAACGIGVRPSPVQLAGARGGHWRPVTFRHKPGSIPSPAALPPTRHPAARPNPPPPLASALRPKIRPKIRPHTPLTTGTSVRYHQTRMRQHARRTGEQLPQPPSAKRPGRGRAPQAQADTSNCPPTGSDP